MVEKNKLNVAIDPAIEDLKDEDDKDLEFTIKFDLLPEIKLNHRRAGAPPTGFPHSTTKRAGPDGLVTVGTGEQQPRDAPVHAAGGLEMCGFMF